jgi:hypothetical protein
MGSKRRQLKAHVFIMEGIMLLKSEKKAEYG